MVGKNPKACPDKTAITGMGLFCFEVEVSSSSFHQKQQVQWKHSLVNA